MNHNAAKTLNYETGAKRLDSHVNEQIYNDAEVYLQNAQGEANSLNNKSQVGSKRMLIGASSDIMNKRKLNQRSQFGLNDDLRSVEHISAAGNQNA